MTMAKAMRTGFVLLLGAVGLVLWWGSSLSVAAESMEKAAISSGPLDGKVFEVESGKMGKGTDSKDTLVFKDGRFRSLGCDRYGFGDGAYTATAKGDVSDFQAETVSAAEGKMMWKGTVQGDKIDVRYTWYKSPRWYRFTKTMDKWAKGGLKKSP